MEKKKTDRRTLYTEMVIKDAFCELLRKKEYSEIKIAEICRIADINRSTFYQHYLDIYDVLDEISHETVDKLMSLSEPTSSDLTDLSNIRIANENIIADKEMTFLISKISSYSGYIDAFCKRLAERYTDMLKDRSSLNRDELIMILESLIYSYQVMDMKIWKNHSLEELENYNNLFNEYIIIPCLDKLSRK